MEKDGSLTDHQFVHQVSEDLEGGLGISYEVTIPRQMTGFDISTVRVGRLGGADNEDLAFRQQLYEVVGSITVAGGHVEAAMKRMLLILRGGDTVFSLVDHQWAELHQKLAAECDGSDDRRRRLKEVLEWAEEANLRENRHTAVHGAWWIYSGCGARVSRWPRRKDDRLILASIEQWRAVAEMLWEFVARLDDLLGDDWPRAMLPANDPVR